MSMTMKGWLKDPADIKYVSFDTVHRAFTAQASPQAQSGKDYDIPYEPPAYDQLDLGACVPNAACGAANMVLSVEQQQPVLLSRLFLYWLCRESMGTVDRDSGTFPSLAVDRIGKIGVCGEDIWQYTDANFALPPPPETYKEASDNKITAWYRIDAQGPARLSQLEIALRSNHPVIFGTPCSNTIQMYRAGQVLGAPAPGTLTGGHSMTFSGIRYVDGQRVWRIRNSWSPAYGDNGHLLIDDSWASWPSLDDLWVLTRINPILL
jgi:hypothetical protein